MKFIKIKIDGGTLPTKGTKGSAGWDLYAPRDGTLWPGSVDVVDLGFSLELQNCAAILSHRSGMNIRGIWAYGLIDPDYRGNVRVTLHNKSITHFKYKKGDRIAQMRLVVVPEARILVVDELSDTDRGEGGHGSTGE